MNPKIVFETPWFNIEEETYNIKGVDQLYYRMNLPNGVILVVLTEDNKLVMVKQYRTVIDAVTLEIPAGYMEKGEEPLETARRELYEETGFKCTRWVLLPGGRPFVSKVKNYEHIVLGTGAVKDPSFVPMEDIETVLVPPTSVLPLYLEGRIESFTLLAALVIADRMGGVNLLENMK